MESGLKYVNWSSTDVLNCCKQVYLENAHDLTKYNKQTLITLSSSIFFVCLLFFIISLIRYIKLLKENKKKLKYNVDAFIKFDLRDKRSILENNKYKFNLGRCEFKEKVIFQDSIGHFNDTTFYKGSLLSGKKIVIKKWTSSDFRFALSEIDGFLAAGSHPNILKFYGARTDIINGLFLCTFVEFCRKGKLKEFVQQMDVGNDDQNYLQIDFYKLNQFAVDIASGMEFVSSRNLIHGELSASCVYITDKNTCKIGDFSMSRKLNDDGVYVKVSDGPTCWKRAAPEALLSMTFSEKSDVWSFGVTMWEIFSFGADPYAGLFWSADFVSKYEAGVCLSRPELASEELYEIMSSCWNFEANLRPTFKSLAQGLPGYMNGFYYMDLFDNT